MMLHTWLLLLLIASVATTLAGAKGASPAFYTQQICLTTVDTTRAKSVPTSTQSYTFTFPFPIISKSTSTKTISPKPTTVTSTTTATSIVTITQSTHTDTATVTSTPVTTSTISVTQIDTATSTSTMITTTITPPAMTTTIGTFSGYTALASQLSSEGYPAYSRRRRRSLVEEGPTEGRTVKRISGDNQMLKGGNLFSRARNLSKWVTSYPHNVLCKKFVEEIIYKTVVVPAYKTVTSTAKQFTSTSIYTSTITSTLQVAAPPNAQTTVTVTLPTSTVPSTTTTTITTTTTTVEPAASTAAPPPAVSVFPACQSNNIIRGSQGGDIFFVSISPVVGGNGFQDYTMVSSTTSGLQCCQSCQLALLTDLKSCAFYIYNDNNKQCQLATDDSRATVYSLETGTYSEPLIVGNGNDGYCNGVVPS